MKNLFYVGMMVLSGWSCAWAQTAGAAPGMSLRQAWACGGWVMWVLAVLSVVALALMVYCFAALRSTALIPPALVSDVLASIKAGDALEARRLCERESCAFAAVASAALERYCAAPTADASLVRDAIETAGARHADAIQGQTEYLLDIATIAPLLGLLGTVLGMLTAFGSIASDIASAKPVVLAAGVSQAIVTTVFGLIVAIPCMAAYAYLRRRANSRIADLEEAAADVAAALELAKH